MKRWWLAAIFSVLVLGGGYLYVGRPLRFVVAVSIFVFIWLALIFGSYLSTFAGFVLGTLNLVLFLPFTVIDPAVVARRTPISVQRWYMKWPVVILYVIAMPFVLGAIKDYALPPHTSADRLGFDLYYATSDAMAPTVREGDYVLMDTKYYRQHSPAVGDIVVARPVNGVAEYLRRVYAVTDNSVWVAADKGWTASSDFLNNVEIPFSSLKGRATYVLLAKDVGRVGTKIIDQDQPNADPFVSKQ